MARDLSPLLAIGMSLIVALVLRLLALPGNLAFLNPDWVLLVLLYWCLHAPERCGIGLAWLAGLWADAATGRPLGQQALIYGLAAYLCLRFHKRLRIFPLHQQLVLILAFLLGAQLLSFFLEVLRGHPALPWRYWLPSLTGALAWPPVVAGCNFLKQRFLSTL